MRISKLVAGGQSGVDRAALDVALRLGIPIGGWCPRERWAEDGRIPDHYPLQETATGDVAVRTELNVIHSDATLILTVGTPQDGTAFTKVCAEHHRRPLLELDLDGLISTEIVATWIKQHNVNVLNVAGPRESYRPGFIYGIAYQCVLSVLSEQFS